MTVCGVVAHRDVAIAWADTETFNSANVSIGHANKLHVNAGGCFASVGAGLSSLSGVVADVVATARTLDDALAPMGAALRRKVERMSRDPRMDPWSLAGHNEFLVGWSARIGRLVGYEICGDALFIARLATRCAAPWIPEVDALDPLDPWALASVARQQLARLRADYPDARGGMLSVAVVTPGRVESGPLFRFDDAPGAWLWPGPRLTAFQGEPQCLS